MEYLGQSVFLWWNEQANVQNLILLSGWDKTWALLFTDVLYQSKIAEMERKQKSAKTKHYISLLLMKFQKKSSLFVPKML